MHLKKPIKLGLLGTTGVGKDTCVNIIKTYFPFLSISLVRLADPLYQAQQAIYKICSKNNDYYQQDGELLNFLGLHMRKINPDVLKQTFITTMQNSISNIDCIICPDIRPADVAFVKNAGFSIIYIDANPEITLTRRKLRGDTSLGKSNHITETGITSTMYDYLLTNNGSMQEFQTNINTLISQLIT